MNTCNISHIHPPLSPSAQALTSRLSYTRAGNHILFIPKPLHYSHRPTTVSVVSKQAVAAPPSPSTTDRVAAEYDCIVVGGGISGLCTAQALMSNHKNSAPSILVTEAQDRVGGNITTTRAEGHQWEEGPNSFQPNEAMLKCAVEVGLKEELLLADPDSPRFVLWGGRLRPVPAGLGDLPFFDLLSPLGKIRAGLGALGIRPPAPDREESVEEFVRRNLGAEVFERLIEPFCSGVYAGDPAKLSMKAAFGKVWKLEGLGGSIVGGSFKMLSEKRKNPSPPRDPNLPVPKGQTVGSFRSGLSALPTAIAKQLGERVKVGWKLQGVEKQGSLFRLQYHTPEGPISVTARSVVLTVPAYVAATLIAPFSEVAGAALASFYYPPVAAVTLSYPQEAIRPERLEGGVLKGFGQLHPRREGIQTLGTLYSSSLFPGRAPEGRVLLLCYIGGVTNEGITRKGDAALLEAVDRDLRKMLIRPDAPPPTLLGARVWDRAIPQFNVGHLEKLEEVRGAVREADLEGLFLGGNYVAGVALGRCVEGAYESASEVASFLSAVRL